MMELSTERSRLCTLWDSQRLGPLLSRSELELQRSADRVTLARYAPASMVVDERMHVVQLRGPMAAYLRPAAGITSWHLRRVLRPEMCDTVLDALIRCRAEHMPVAVETEVQTDGRTTPLRIEVVPLPVTTVGNRCLLVCLQDVAATAVARGKRRPQTTPRVPSLPDKPELMQKQKAELTSLRFNLASLMQERDAQYQELASASWDLRVSNEDLQDANAKLAAVKSEVQNANDNLRRTVHELNLRNASLAETSNVLTNLISSANMPILMLTNELCVRRFTPPMRKLFGMSGTDINKHIKHLTGKLQFGPVLHLLEQVAETLTMVEAEVQDVQGHWYRLQIRPYKTVSNVIDGLVLALVDIHQQRLTQQVYMEARDYVESLMECVPVPIAVVCDDLSVQKLNTAFRQLAGLGTDEGTHGSFPALLERLWGVDTLRQRLVQLFAGHLGEEFEFEHDSTTADRKFIHIKGLAVRTDGKAVALIVLDDLTARHYTELILEEQRRTLMRAVEVANRELDQSQREMRHLTAHLFTVQEEERRKVARELHDDISQRLSVLDLSFTECFAEDGSGTRADRVAATSRQLQDLCSDVRAISHQLHPAILDDLGLSTALRAMVTEFGRRESMVVSYIPVNLAEVPMQPAVTAIYRVAQEALRNVARHAGKTHVKVILESRDQRLRLEVVDLGNGFDEEPYTGHHDGLGLISMRERVRMAGGTLTIRSSLGYGTTVCAEVPYAPET